MWNEIIDDNTCTEFMKDVDYFHDSCIKELKYYSGAYVDENLSMHPINDCRTLNVIIQRQYEKKSMIEMKFEGVQYLKIFPIDDKYSCEILGATIIFKDDSLYWCDCDGLTEDDIRDYEGTLVCASKLKWRFIENCMGKAEFYLSMK